MRREIFSEEHDLFRGQVRRFVEREVEPKVPEWNERGMTDREVWRRLGEEGLLGTNQRVEYGGAGGDFLYDAILIEELARAHALAVSLHCGFMMEYAIAGDYADAAVQSIYAGSNEIVKVIIARRLGLGG